MQLMASGLRSRVLSLYRRVLRTGQSWQAQDPKETETEKLYILSEAREVFRANKLVSDPDLIMEHLTEGESRLEMGKEDNYSVQYWISLLPWLRSIISVLYITHTN